MLKEKQEQFGNESSQNGRGRDHDRGRGQGGFKIFNHDDRRQEPSSSGGHKRNNHAVRNYSPQIKCYNCQRFVHYASNCKTPKRNEERVNFVEDKIQEVVTLLIT